MNELQKIEFTKLKVFLNLMDEKITGSKDVVDVALGLGAGFARGGIGFFTGLTGLGVGLATDPISTGKGLYEGIKQIPTEFVKAPAVFWC